MPATRSDVVKPMTSNDPGITDQPEAKPRHHKTPSGTIAATLTGAPKLRSAARGSVTQLPHQMPESGRAAFANSRCIPTLASTKLPTTSQHDVFRRMTRDLLIACEAAYQGYQSGNISVLSDKSGVTRNRSEGTMGVHGLTLCRRTQPVNRQSRWSKMRLRVFWYEFTNG